LEVKQLKSGLSALSKPYKPSGPIPSSTAIPRAKEVLSASRLPKVGDRDVFGKGKTAGCGSGNCLQETRKSGFISWHLEVTCC
jgi:hypothetical protein